MSKTARDVIAQALWDCQSSGVSSVAADAFVTQLNAAGFVIVPKVYVLCYPGVPAAWHVKPEDLQTAAQEPQP